MSDTSNPFCSNGSSPPALDPDTFGDVWEDDAETTWDTPRSELPVIDDGAAFRCYQGTKAAVSNGTATVADDVSTIARRLVEMTGIDTLWHVSTGEYTLPGHLSRREQYEMLVTVYWAAQELYELSRAAEAGSQVSK